MATVYAATDLTTGERLALKRLESASPRTLALFEQEYQTLASLRHPAIVQVYDYVRDEQGPFYTMELLHGSDLSRKAPMPWREVCSCLRDVAAILGVLHVRQLVYRDLSPKNLWLASDGHLKLLDFGALTTFGIARELAGTAPLMAPETVQGEPLDGRTDLFSLGALGFWLLTGNYPYPAHGADELLELHQGPAISPSSLERALARKGISAVPHELAEIIASLLRIDPRERLASTSELIDRLSMLADLEPEAYAVTASSYVHSKPLVGRGRELAVLVDALGAAREGTPRWLSIEGERGSGRTRLAQEVAVLARLNGALCVTAGPLHDVPALGVARVLLRSAIQAMPSFGKHVEQQPAWRALLELEGSEVRLLDADGRPAPALVALWLDVWSKWTASTAVAMIVDDIERADAASMHLLTALAQRLTEGRLLVALTASEREGPQELAGVPVTQLHLDRLTIADTALLLQSMFGSHAQVERLATWLHRATHGNPAQSLQRIERLVESEVIQYREGLWVLPREIDLTKVAGRVPWSQADRDALSEPARALARRLSIPRFRDLTRHECSALAQLETAQLDALLAELQDANVLLAPAHEGRFASDDVRRALYAELSREQVRALHGVLADTQVARADVDAYTLVHASDHYLRAEQTPRAVRLWQKVFRENLGTAEFLRAIAPIVEDGYLHLVESGANESTMALPLAVLAIAGYLVDRRYALLYGDKALELLGRLLHVRLAHAARPYVGRALALVVAVTVAALLLLPKRAAPSIRDLLVLYVAACSALSGTAATFVDGESAARYAESVEPFAAWGSRSAPWLVHAFAQTVTLMVSDHRALAQRRAGELLQRIQGPAKIRGLREDQRAQYVSALLFCMGVNARFRDDPEVLEIADRLERLDSSAARNANHLRASYFVSQGQHAAASECLRRVEAQTIQLGTAWQTELWLPADAMSIAMRLDDALMMKRAARELARVALDVPSLALNAQQARGMYLVMRGKHAQAIPLLETDEQPLARMGWLRGRAMLARAHNGLREYARAREIGLQALALLDDEDRRYVRMGSLQAAIEVALAEAALGEGEQAKARLDELMAFHAPQRAPLTLGAIHEAHAKVALERSLYAEARWHTAQLERWIRPTAIPAWIDRIEALEEQLAQLAPDSTSGVSAYPPTPRQRMPSALRALLREDESVPAEERASHLLRAVVTHCRAERGYLFRLGTDAPLAQVGAEPTAALTSWAKQRLIASDLDEADTVVSDAQRSVFTYFGGDELDVFHEGPRCYSFTPLWSSASDPERLVGALVIGDMEGPPPRVEIVVARAVAAQLARHVRDADA